MEIFCLKNLWKNWRTFEGLEEHSKDNKSTFEGLEGQQISNKLKARDLKISRSSQDNNEDRIRGALFVEEWKNKDCTHYLINAKLYLWNTFYNLFDFLQLRNFVFTGFSNIKCAFAYQCSWTVFYLLKNILLQCVQQ